MFDLVRRRASSLSTLYRARTPRGLDPAGPYDDPRAATGRRARACAAALAAVLAAGALAATAMAAKPIKASFLASLKKNTNLGTTIPPNGDLNPYGIVTVPRSTGSLVAGNILVSNFNNSKNKQGTGTTIVQLTPKGHLSVFAQLSAGALPGPCPGGVGLTTALAVLPQGFVVVGSLPTSNGMAETAQAGCLIVLDSGGHPVQTISGGPINGPWDMTAVNQGNTSTLFVANVLNGTVAKGEEPTDEGTVVRIRVNVHPNNGPVVKSIEVIAEGFPERTDPAALVIGPTGVALGDDGTLYVADTQGNRIAAVSGALNRHAPVTGAGETVAAGGFLNSPLGMTIAPNGDILTANAGDGNIVETTPAGAQFAPLDTGAEGGGLFGLAITPDLRGLYYVNDTENSLGLLR
jgi:hypothetical protein